MVADLIIPLSFTDFVMSVNADINADLNAVGMCMHTHTHTHTHTLRHSHKHTFWLLQPHTYISRNQCHMKATPTL
jgi:hypothetical protein